MTNIIKHLKYKCLYSNLFIIVASFLDIPPAFLNTINYAKTMWRWISPLKCFVEYFSLSSFAKLFSLSVFSALPLNNGKLFPGQTIFVAFVTLFPLHVYIHRYIYYDCNNTLTSTDTPFLSSGGSIFNSVLVSFLGFLWSVCMWYYR